MRIEHILAIMQDFVVGVPPVWIHLLRWVSKVVLVYIDAVEGVEAEEAEEAWAQGDQDDRGDQGGPSDRGGQA